MLIVFMVCNIIISALALDRYTQRSAGDAPHICAVSLPGYPSEMLVRELSDRKGDTQTVLSPSTVQGKVQAVCAGDGNNFAITESGDLYGWGSIDLSPDPKAPLEADSTIVVIGPDKNIEQIIKN